jgi:Histone methylation protein DOT1
MVDMTTSPNELSLHDGIRWLTQDLQNFLGSLANDSSLFHPKQLRERLDALDELDIRFGDFSAEEYMNDPDARIINRAKAMRARIEAVNTALYESIRSEIVRGAPPQPLLQWIQAPASREKTASGLGYDYRDEVVAGVLQLREPREPRFHPLPEMVFYQPTPVRHILHLITASAFTQGDVFVDLGSGLGHVALLTAMLTGVRSFGIEVDPAYVASAQECAQSLHLSQVRFIREDARAADLSRGTVFYLYSPFTGSILDDVLARLKQESKSRPIKIGALGPCTCILAKESWLKPMAPPDPKQITVFQRRL